MVSLFALTLVAAQAAASPCDSLKSLTLQNTTITSTQLVAAGPYSPTPPPLTGVGGAPAPAPAGGRGGGAAPPPAPPTMLPAHCRVFLTSKPSSDSDIKIEVWLPVADAWNGKFQAVGNGLWAGVISYGALAAAVRDGYAAASTDTGHEGNNATFAIGHPEKLVDFAYRAVHEMAVQSKAVINSFYNRAPRLSYWNGCSTGGRQGLMAAQRYPEDFDAIVAGAPANYQTHLHLWDLSVAAPILRDPAGAVPATKLQMVNRAIVNACDAQDGLRDGLLNDPRACKFDIGTLACTGGPSTALGAGDSESCLTAPQVATMRRVYAPARTKDGTIVFPGKDPGSEASWAAAPPPLQLLNGQPPGVPIGSFQVAFEDAKWDPKTFELDRDLKIVDAKVGSIVNATNPDLRAFKARGGKVILYHGWHDTAISAGNTIDYYTSVQKRMGGKQDDFIRLFMAPGMNHCSGGVGPNQANWMAALERWREKGDAPDEIPAAVVSGPNVIMTRPLCPYPEVAVYSGTGSIYDAGNFSCKAP